MPARLLQWRRVKKAVRSFAKRNRQRLLEWREALLPTEETFHLLLAAFVGVMAGAMNFLFYHATEGLKWALFGRGGDPVLLAEHLSRWARLLAPCLGGAAAGWLLQWGRRVFPTNRSTNLLEVVIAGDGRLPFRATLTKALSSLASIATGASIGREGSIVQLSALSASQAGQLARWPPYRLRLLVACGAAAGIASAYNAPIAGAVFAAQIILGTFAMSLFAPLLCASVAATMVSRSLFGIEALYQVPQVEFTRLFQLPWFFALGAAAGAAGAGFLKLMDLSRRAFDKTPLPLWARLAAAGALVGLIGLRFPEVWGNGYLATSRILIGYELYTLEFLIGLFLAKVLCTVVTVGAGTVGGVFTPTLFVGAALGGLFGHLLHSFGAAPTTPAGVFALVGMGSVMAATTHAPLLAIIVVFEITVNYSLMPPLMLACAVATVIGRRLHPASVYTEPLHRKGILLAGETYGPSAEEITVGDLMTKPVPPIRETATLPEIANRFLTSGNNFLPVADQTGRLVGMVTIHDLKEHLTGGDELRAFIALDIMRPPPRCLTPRMKLSEALPTLLTSEQRNVPVVNNYTEFRLVGAVARSDALSRLSEAIARSRGGR